MEKAGAILARFFGDIGGIFAGQRLKTECRHPSTVAHHHRSIPFPHRGASPDHLDGRLQIGTARQKCHVYSVFVRHQFPMFGI